MSRARKLSTYPDCPDCEDAFWVTGSNKHRYDYECLHCGLFFDVEES